MKRFAILFAALCIVAFVSSDSYAQCAGGGGFYSRGISYGGGGIYRGGGGFYNVGNIYRGNVYRPSVGISYGYARPVPVYRNYGVGYGYGYGRPVYGGGLYRPGCGYGRGISIRF